MKISLLFLMIFFLTLSCNKKSTDPEIEISQYNIKFFSSASTVNVYIFTLTSENIFYEYSSTENGWIKKNSPPISIDKIKYFVGSSTSSNKYAYILSKDG